MSFDPQVFDEGVFGSQGFSSEGCLFDPAIFDSAVFDVCEEAEAEVVEAFLLHGGGAGRKKDHSVREELKRLFADPGDAAEEVKAIVWPHAEMIRGQVHIDWASLKSDLQAIDRLLRLMQEDDDISILLLQ